MKVYHLQPRIPSTLFTCKPPPASWTVLPSSRSCAPVHSEYTAPPVFPLMLEPAMDTEQVGRPAGAFSPSMPRYMPPPSDAVLSTKDALRRDRDPPAPSSSPPPKDALLLVRMASSIMRCHAGVGVHGASVGQAVGCWGSTGVCTMMPPPAPPSPTVLLLATTLVKARKEGFATAPWLTSLKVDRLRKAPPPPASASRKREEAPHT